MRFLCTGDHHFGKGADLGREPGERLAEQEAVWSQILDLAQQHEAWVLHAGDVFEGPIPTPEHYAAFARPIIRGGRPAPILAITGNGRHDAAMRSTNALQAFQVTGLDVHSRPALVPFGGALVACLPWASVKQVVAAQDGGDRDNINEAVAAGVVEIARGLHAEATVRDPDGKTPRILLGHWSVGGSTTPSGAPVDLFREPVLPLEELAAIGFDAMVFGHIHRPQMLGATGFYTGSPMPLDFGEANTEHCVWLLDVEPGQIPTVTQIPVESRRLEVLELEVDELLDPDVGLGFDGWDLDGVIVKARIAATPEQARRLDTAAIKRALEAAGAHKVWQVTVEVHRADAVPGATLDEDMTDVEALAEWLAMNVEDEPAVAELFDIGTGYIQAAA